MKKLFGILCAMTLVIGVSSMAKATLYEDGADASDWFIKSGSSVSATATASGGVIQLSGQAGDKYVLGACYNPAEGTSWSNTTEFVAEWDMLSSASFAVNWSVATDGGVIYIQYKPGTFATQLAGSYVQVSLGADANDGSWHSFSQDLQDDLDDVTSLSIVSVNGVVFKEDASVDNIELTRSTGTSVPDAAAVFLLGTAALVGFAGLRRKSKKK